MALPSMVGLMVASVGRHADRPVCPAGATPAIARISSRAASGGTCRRPWSSVPAMDNSHRSISRCLLVAVAVIAMTPAVAGAAVPDDGARYAPCPVPTDDPARYEGEHAPFRCHSAVTDPDGLVVILREGRAADAG